MSSVTSTDVFLLAYGKSRIDIHDVICVNHDSPLRWVAIESLRFHLALRSGLVECPALGNAPAASVVTCCWLPVSCRLITVTFTPGTAGAGGVGHGTDNGPECPDLGKCLPAENASRTAATRRTKKVLTGHRRILPFVTWSTTICIDKQPECFRNGMGSATTCEYFGAATVRFTTVRFTNKSVPAY